MKIISINRVIGSGYISLAFQAFPLIIGLISVPLNIEILGNELWGVYSISVGFIFIFMYFSLGVGPAISYELPKLININDSNQISKLLSNGFIITISIAICFSVIGYLLADTIAIKLFNIKSTDYFYLFQYSSICGGLAVIISFQRSIFESSQDFFIVSVNRILISCSLLTAPIINHYIFNQPAKESIILILYSYILVSLIYVLLIRKKYKQITIFNYDQETIIKLISFGKWISFQSIIHQFFLNIDRMIISSFIGVNQVAFYTTPYDLLSKLTVISTSLTAGLIPGVSYWTKNNMVKNIKTIEKKLIKKFLLIYVPILVFLFLLAEEILKQWISSEYMIKSSSVFKILVIAFCINSFSNMYAKLLIALNKPNLFFYISSISTIIFIFCCFVLVNKFAIEGVAFAVFLKVSVDLIGNFFFFKKTYKSIYD